MVGEHKGESILVAMSGGVDSSVAALILKNAGYNVKGAILRMHDIGMTQEDISNGKLPMSIWYAREAARKLRLDFNIFDIRKTFRNEVISGFVAGNKNGQMPNPCIFCNKNLKFPEMFWLAQKLGCDKVASGHLAIIEYNKETDRYVLKKSIERGLDQSYMLYRLSQDELGKLMLPLGTHKKEEIRKIAAEAGLKNARVPDSSSICFFADGNGTAFLTDYLIKTANPDIPVEEIEGLIPGNFVDLDGNVVGKHNGFVCYTVGQSVEDMYVCGKNPGTNEIVLGSEKALYTRTVRAREVNFVSLPELKGDSMRVTGKVRSIDADTPGTAQILPDGALQMQFDEPVRAAIPGQSLVIYDDDTLIAGGVIV